MRFEDERYIRVYTRDTTTILMLSWEARALMWETLRKLDRAGLLDLGADGIEALAIATRMPLDVVERALPELLRRQVFDLRPDGLLVAPRFLEAQEARASDAARAKAHRERTRAIARAGAITNRDDCVQRPRPATGDADGRSAVPTADHATPRLASDTDGDATITPRDKTVTPSHTASLRAVPCRAVPVERSAKPISPRPPARPARAKTPRGTRLPEDWQPTPELLDRLRRELRVDPMPAIRQFVTYWLNANRNAVKPRWDLAFEHWVAKDAAAGKLPAVEPELPVHRIADRERFIPRADEPRPAAINFGAKVTP